LTGFFRSIPTELEEAALIDGATRTQAFVRVLLPLSAPGILAAGLFCFTLAWNEFLYALIFISSDRRRTLPVVVFYILSAKIHDSRPDGRGGQGLVLRHGELPHQPSPSAPRHRSVRKPVIPAVRGAAGRASTHHFSVSSGKLIG
jgi:hypothetical protein